jgi:Ca-activated chloride channel family protein
LTGRSRGSSSAAGATGIAAAAVLSLVGLTVGVQDVAQDKVQDDARDVVLDVDPGSGAQTPVQETTPDRPPLSVFLDRPDPFRPAFGEVEMEATVVTQIPVERVVFYVDGIVVGERTEPPWKVTVGVGSGNAEHRFEVIAHGEGGITASAVATTPAIRVDDEVKISLQQLYVTVTDRTSGERVLSLRSGDFEILDEGRSQKLVTFARGDIPFTSIVLLDSSVSMEGAKLRSAVEGAAAFFGGMRGLDEGKLLVFSDRILHTTPFTTVPEVLTAGLSGIRARGGTAVADHVYLALQQIEARQGRRVVVLLSDGVDSHSVLRMERVLERARRSQALIYWLQLPYREGADPDELPSLRGFWRTAEEYRQQFEMLRRVVEESAGRVRVLESAGDIEPAFREILRELREQYVLGYYPSVARHDGSFRRVRVKVDRAGTDVRCQSGYLDL